MPEKRINLYLNPYQTEVLEKIRTQHDLVAKTDNDVIRFIIDDYYKQTKKLHEAHELIKVKLNAISRESSLTLNSLLNLLAQQNIEITKANDQMIQYHQANKLLNNEIVGQKNPNSTTPPQYTPEEIEAIKRQQREEKRKELAKKMGMTPDEPSSNPSDSLFDLQNQNPF